MERAVRRGCKPARCDCDAAAGPENSLLVHSPLTMPTSITADRLMRLMVTNLANVALPVH